MYNKKYFPICFVEDIEELRLVLAENIKRGVRRHIYVEFLDDIDFENPSCYKNYDNYKSYIDSKKTKGGFDALVTNQSITFLGNRFMSNSISIKNLYSVGKKCGMAGFVCDITASNTINILYLSFPYVTLHSEEGSVGIISQCGDSKIYGTYLNGSIKGGYAVGSMIGYSNGVSELGKLTVDADIQGEQFIGNLVGYGKRGRMSDIELTNSLQYNDINLTASRISDLVHQNFGNSDRCLKEEAVTYHLDRYKR